MIQDSGNRREFQSGAVRDIQDGKGREDLLPLSEIDTLIWMSKLFPKEALGSPLGEISMYLSNRNIERLYTAILAFWDGDIYTCVLEVARHFEEGAVKYGERNWEKGIPCHCYLDSAIRHFLKHERGDTDERHDRAFVWNILCLIWTIKNKPELNDI